MKPKGGKTKKRFTKVMVALLLVAAMIVTLCPAVSAAHFKDVPATMDTKYRDAINYVSDNGIIIGDDLGYFYADQKIYRADYVLILYRLSGDFYYDGDATDDFTDVSASDYFYHAVGWAVENNITSGATATTFNPYGYVTREQAFTFLYRLAGHMNYDQNADEVISQAEDYALVSTYAYDPISWVYEYGILTRNALTDNIFPNTEITRKEVALFAARFRRNVEGIVFGRDNFSFTNTDACFVSSPTTPYYMARNERIRFVDYTYAAGLTVQDVFYISAEKWGGSCYGMAIAAVLDYLGKIDLNGNCCIDIPNLASIYPLSLLDKPGHQLTKYYNDPSIEITVVESKINFYQQSQHIPSIKTWKEKINVNDGIAETLDALEHSGIGVFCYSWVEGGFAYGHAVVAYGKPIQTETGYKIKIYDNRDIGGDRWIDISLNDNNKWTAKIKGFDIEDGQEENVLYCKFLTDFSIYDSYDLDNYDNVSSIQSIGSQDDGHAMVEVCATGDFTVTNSAGETLIFSLENSELVSGTMDVFGIDFICAGDSTPCTFQFLVEASQEFICEPGEDGEIKSFYVYKNTLPNDESMSTMNVSNMDVTQ